MPPRKSRVDPIKAVVRRVVEMAVGGGGGGGGGVSAGGSAQEDAAPSSQRSELFRELRAVIEASAEDRARLVALLFDELSDARVPATKRLGVLRVMDDLFKKSRLFRDATVDALHSSIRKICLGKESNQAEILRNEVAVAFLHVLHNWDARFGEYYPLLNSMARYYRNAVRVINVGDDGAEAPVALTDPLRARAERDRRLLLATCERAVRECSEAISHIEQSLDTAEEIFRLLFPSFEMATPATSRPESPLTKRRRIMTDDITASNSVPSDSYSAVEWEANDDEDDGDRGTASADLLTSAAARSTISGRCRSFGNDTSSVVQTVTSAGLGSLGYNLEINIGITASSMTSNDTEALIEQLKAIYVQLSRSSLRKLSDWHDLFQCTMAELSKIPESDSRQNGRDRSSAASIRNDSGPEVQPRAAAIHDNSPPSLLTVQSLQEIDAAASSLRTRVEAFLNERGHDFFDR